MAAALFEPTGPTGQGEHVARAQEVLGPGIGIGETPDGGGPVVGGHATASDPSVVSRLVMGIRATENRSVRTSATVRLTPSTATDALPTTSSMKRLGGRSQARCPDPSSSSIRMTRPTASTCPCTRCPSSGSPTASGSSG